MLARREATQREAQCKAAKREANKEQRRKDKEECAEVIRGRKVLREAKKKQRKQEHMEHQAARDERRQGKPSPPVDLDNADDEEPTSPVKLALQLQTLSVLPMPPNRPAMSPPPCAPSQAGMNLATVLPS